MAESAPARPAPPAEAEQQPAGQPALQDEEQAGPLNKFGTAVVGSSLGGRACLLGQEEQQTGVRAH